MKISKQSIQIAKESPLFIKATIIIGTNLILTIIVLFIIRQLFSLYTDIGFLESQVNDTRQKVDIIERNKAISQNEVANYNEILDQLIPPEESYFNVINALETLAQRNNVRILEYSINLQQTTPEKFSLVVAIEGNPSSINSFLQNYMYSSGRLITNDSLEFHPQKLDSLEFNLNFYHKEVASSEIVQDTTITTEDIQLIAEIATQL